MGVKRGRRRVGGIVITCGSRARREGSPRSRARAVGHGVGFRAQRSDYPYNWTSIEAARENGHDAIAKLLSSARDRMPLDRGIPTNEVRQMKRRALLVGITYSNTSSNMWPQLCGPHDDVDNYRELLVSG